MGEAGVAFEFVVQHETDLEDLFARGALLVAAGRHARHCVVHETPCQRAFVRPLVGAIGSLEKEMGGVACQCGGQDVIVMWAVMVGRWKWICVVASRDVAVCEATSTTCSTRTRSCTWSQINFFGDTNVRDTHGWRVNNFTWYVCTYGT